MDYTAQAWGDVKVSSQKGNGEETMNEFIHKHLCSLLEPFAQYLEQLKAKVETLSTEQRQLISKSDLASIQLKENESDLSRMRLDNDKIRLQVDSLQSRLDAKVQELTSGKASMTAELERQASAKRDLEARQQNSEQALVTLQQELLATKQTVNCLQMSSTTLEMSLKGVSTSSVNALRDDLDGLCKSHQTLSQLLKQVEQGKQTDHTELKSLQDLFTFYREKEEGKSKEMNASFSALKLHFQQTDDAVQKLCGSRVATMCQEMDELQRNIQKVQKGQAANEIHLNRTAGEVDTLRASIVNFRRYLGVTNESDVSDLDIFGNLNSLKEAAHKTTLQLRKTEVEHLHLSSELQQSLQRIGDLEAITPKLQASSKAFAEQLGSRLEKVEVILHESAEALKSHTDLSAFLNSESRARQQDKVLLQAQLDNQLKQHERTTERLLVLEGLLDELKGLERSLENQLVTANGEIRSLRDGVDLTHEYWKGLTKGVQRTHRSVVTEGDLLALRSSPTRMLPSLSPH